MSGPTSSLFTTLARLALVVTLVAAPWPFGGYPLPWQPPLFAGIVAALVLWWMSVATRPGGLSDSGTIIVDGLIPPVLLILLAAVQLIPIANVPEIPAHAVLADVARPLVEASTAEPHLTSLSVAPALTRETAARLMFGIIAAFLGIQLFGDARQRLWLYVPIAANATALAAFGLWQNAHWDEWNQLMFGQVPIRHGTKPFASFVNRNNAAGLLNMGAAAAAAWAFLAAVPPAVRTSRQQRHDSKPGLEARPSMAFPVIALGVICTGVAASLSRGGLVALAAGAVAALWVLLQARRAKMVGFLLLVAVPVAVYVIGYTPAGKPIRARFAAVTAYDAEKNGRLVHWAETWGAVQDAPLLGQGMGAYRYIHRPYQKMESSGWFVNADNQFFEVLVENGYIGIGLVLLTILLIFVDVRRLLTSRAPWEQRDAALMGGILIATQAVQGLFDFGITLPSNMLTAGALAGAITGAAARSLPFSSVPTLTSPMVFRPRAALPIGLALVVAAGLAWRELSIAARAFVAFDTIPALESTDSVGPLDYGLQLGRATIAAADRPDDAELQRSLGNLLLFGFRRELFEANRKKPEAANLSDELLWAGCRIESLFELSLTLNSDEQREEYLKQIQEVDISGALPQAVAAFRDSMESCRWVPAAAQRHATLLQAYELDPLAARRSLAIAATGCPAEANRLIMLGALAREVEADDLAMACWQRAVDVTPRCFRDLMQAGGEWLQSPERLPRVLPRNVTVCFEYAEAFPGTPVAKAVLNQAEELLKKQGSPSHGQIGQLRLLQGNHEAAVIEFENAIRDEPLGLPLRLKLAEAKAEAGKLNQAIEILKIAEKDFGNLSVIDEKLGEYQRRAGSRGP